jgi:hypothetical protein
MTTGRRESSSINMSPSKPLECRRNESPQLIRVELDSEMAGRLMRWAESSGQSIEQIAHQLLRASITVLGDQPPWSDAPSGDPPTSQP